MAALFNTALESGLRSLIVLDAIRQPADLDLLVLYDYFLVHSGDYPDGPPSLHPAIPYRSGELLVRRDVVRAGLEFIEAKGLVGLFFERQGVAYAATGIASAFLSHFRSPYYTRLGERSAWIADRLQTTPREALFGLVHRNLQHWGEDNSQFLLVPNE